MQANLSYNEGYGHTCTSSVAVGPAIGSGRFNQSYAAVTAFRDVYRTRTPIPSVPLSRSCSGAMRSNKGGDRV